MKARTERKRVQRQQPRSIESQRKILDAAEQLFAARGYQNTKVTDIIRVAGCSVGAFYHQFTDKRRVFDVLYDKYIDRMIRVIDETAREIEAETDLRQMLTRVLRVALEGLNAHVGARLAAEELSLDDATIGERGFVLTDQFLQRIRGVLHQFEAQVGHPRPQQAIAHAIQVDLIVITQHTLRRRNHLPEDEDALIGLLVDAACGILHVTGAEPDDCTA